MKGQYLSKKQILVIADRLVGTKFKDLKLKIDNQNKGSQGLTIESEAFGILANSRQEADFVLAGYELKVTPIKKNKNGTISAKERLVLNIINYLTENTDDFYESSFWKKNEIILILFYLFEDNKTKEDMTIINSYLYNYPKEDFQIIKKDWHIIANKIKNGKAHELSEADTMYLGACTKGKNASSSYRLQPNSVIKAKQRAYSFKNSYMTQLVRKIIGNCGDVEKIIQSNQTEMIFDEYIEKKVSKYLNRTRNQLCHQFGITSNAKNLNELIVSKMLGLKGKVSNSEEFKKANIITKTIRIEKNGRIKESMSFPYFKYTEIVTENWDDSKLKNYFETTKFMFIIFQNNGTDYIFKRVKFWNMPSTIIDKQLFDVWKKTVELIKIGKIVKHIKNGKYYSYFPGSKDNKVAHVRPHGKNRDDTAELPVRDKLTGLKSYEKHCFWLNNSYIKMIVGE